MFAILLCDWKLSITYHKVLILFYYLILMIYLSSSKNEINNKNRCHMYDIIVYSIGT
jgi:hypothetical protein